MESTTEWREGPLDGDVTEVFWDQHGLLDDFFGDVDEYCPCEKHEKGSLRRGMYVELRQVGAVPAHV